MNKGHISTMTDGVPSTDTHGQLHQLQIHKLLQHKGRAVCPEGLNGELAALQFTFPELPLKDTASPGELFWEPQLLEVDLSSTQPKAMTTAIQAPTTTQVLTHSPPDTTEPPYDIAMAVNLHFQGAMEGMQQAFPTASAPVSQHGTLGESHHQWPWGLHPQLGKQKIPQARGDRLSHPSPNGNLHTDSSMGSHTR